MGRNSASSRTLIPLVAIASLLLPLTVFGTITATDRGTGSDGSSSTSLSITLVTMTAGHTGIICLAMDNSNSAGANLTAGSFTDSVGNIWYVRFDSAQAATANNLQQLAVLTSNLTASTSSSNTLTVTFAVACASKAWTFMEASTNTSGAIVAYVNSQVQAASVPTGTPSFSTNFFPSNGDLAIGAGAAEGVDTWAGDADTTNGSWSTKQSTSVGSGLTGMSVISQSKVVNAYGNQTYDPTLTSADTKLGWAVLTETDPKVRAVGCNATSSTTFTATVSYPMGGTANSLGVLCIAADNSNTSTANFPSTMSDTQSNTWTRRTDGVYSPAGANSGAEVAIYTASLATALAVGNTVTGTVSVTIPAKAWVLWEFSPSGAGSVTYVTGNSQNGSTTGTPSYTTPSVTNGNYIIAAGAAEGFNTWVGTTDATNGSWKLQATSGTGTTAGSSMTVTSQWKKVTATATQTYAPTLTSADTILGYVEINDSSPTGPTAQQKAAFFMLFP